MKGGRISVLLSITILGMLLVMPFGTTATPTRGNSWGFTMNEDLHKNFQSYLDVGLDALVSEMRKNNVADISSYGTTLTGSLKTAGAFSEEGNTVTFKIGNFIDSSVDAHAQGLFPYVNKVGDLENYNSTSIPKKQMKMDGSVVYRQKIIVSGDAITDRNGNIEKMDSTITYDSYFHLKGTNIPLPLLLASYIMSTGVDYEWNEIYVSFDMGMSNSTALYFTVSAADLNKKIPISDVSLSGVSPESYMSELHFSVVDIDGNGYLSDGDMFCITGSADAIESLEEIDISIDGSTLMLNSYSPGIFGSRWVDLGTSKIYRYPKEVIDKAENMSMYDNFDFTVTGSYNQHTVSDYSPAMPIYTDSHTEREINTTTTGTYSGKIDVSGLQEKYKSMVESLINTTFPIKIENIDTHSPSFNHGVINEKNGAEYVSLWNKGTEQYNGENVYVISQSNTTSMTGMEIYMYYSPSKKFYVGGEVSMGTKTFVTTPTSYSEASGEINQISSENVNAERLFPWLPDWLSDWLFITILVIVVVIIIVVLVVARRARARRVTPPMQPPQQPPQQGPPTS